MKLDKVVFVADHGATQSAGEERGSLDGMALSAFALAAASKPKDRGERSTRSGSLPVRLKSVTFPMREQAAAVTEFRIKPATADADTHSPSVPVVICWGTGADLMMLRRGGASSGNEVELSIFPEDSKIPREALWDLVISDEDDDSQGGGNGSEWIDDFQRMKTSKVMCRSWTSGADRRHRGRQTTVGHRDENYDERFNNYEEDLQSVEPRDKQPLVLTAIPTELMEYIGLPPCASDDDGEDEDGLNDEECWGTDVGERKREASVKSYRLVALTSESLMQLSSITDQHICLWRFKKANQAPAPSWLSSFPELLSSSPIGGIHASARDREALVSTQRDIASSSASTAFQCPVSVQEQILVDEMISCLFGVDGSIFKVVQMDDKRTVAGKPHDRTSIDESLLHFVVDSRINDSTPMDSGLRSMSQKIGSLCVYRRSIAKFVENQAQRGLVSAAICEAVSGLLKEFEGRLCQLEVMARDSENSPPLTLQKTWFLLQPAKNTLQIVAHICSSIQGLAGGQMLNKVDSVMKKRNASETVKKLCEHLIDRGMAPLSAILRTWITEGILDDPRDDFFIRQRESDHRHHLLNLATTTASAALKGCSAPHGERTAPPEFFIDVAHVPNELLPWSRKVLQTGRYLNVLRACDIGRSERLTGIPQEASSQEAATGSAGQKASTTNTMSSSCRMLVRAIDHANKLASRKLVAYFFNELQLVERISWLSRFFFFRRADAFHIFLGKLLNQDSKIDDSILLSRVQSSWENCLRICNISNKAGPTSSATATANPFAKVDEDKLAFRLSCLTLQEASRWFNECTADVTEVHDSMDQGLVHKISEGSPGSSRQRVGLLRIPASEIAAATGLPLNEASAWTSSYFDEAEHLSGSTSAEDTAIGSTAAPGTEATEPRRELLSKPLVAGTGAGAMDGNLSSRLTLVYRCQWPLNLVFSPTAVLKYQLIFRLLLHFKFVERQLSDVWQEFSSSKQVKNTTNFGLYHFTPHKMVFFCRNFIYYCTMEVLEPEIQQLTSRLKASSDNLTMERVMELHDGCLSACLRKCLLTDASLLRSLMKVLSMCSLFARHALKFSAYTPVEPDQFEPAAPSAVIRAAQDGVNPEEAAIRDAKRQHRRRHVVAHYARLAEDQSFHAVVGQYARHFDRLAEVFFMEVAAKSRTRYEHYLTNLVLRMNFNGFYSSSEFAAGP